LRGHNGSDAKRVCAASDKKTKQKKHKIFRMRKRTVSRHKNQAERNRPSALEKGERRAQRFNAILGAIYEWRIIIYLFFRSATCSSREMFTLLYAPLHSR